MLWEFTDQDDTYPVDSLGNPSAALSVRKSMLSGQPVKDLGYTFSQPQIVLSNINEPARRCVKVGRAVRQRLKQLARLREVVRLLIEEGLDGWRRGDFVKIDTRSRVTLAT